MSPGETLISRYLSLGRHFTWSRTDAVANSGAHFGNCDIALRVDPLFIIRSFDQHVNELWWHGRRLSNWSFTYLKRNTRITCPGEAPFIQVTGILIIWVIWAKVFFRVTVAMGIFVDRCVVPLIWINSRRIFFFCLALHSANKQLPRSTRGANRDAKQIKHCPFTQRCK